MNKKQSSFNGKNQGVVVFMMEQVMNATTSFCLFFQDGFWNNCYSLRRQRSVCVFFRLI